MAVSRDFYRRVDRNRASEYFRGGRAVLCSNLGWRRRPNRSSKVVAGYVLRMAPVWFAKNTKLFEKRVLDLLVGMGTGGPVTPAERVVKRLYDNLGAITIQQAAMRA